MFIAPESEIKPSSFRSETGSGFVSYSAPKELKKNLGSREFYKHLTPDGVKKCSAIKCAK